MLSPQPPGCREVIARIAFSRIPSLLSLLDRPVSTPALSDFVLLSWVFALFPPSFPPLSSVCFPRLFWWVVVPWSPRLPQGLTFSRSHPCLVHRRS